MDMMLRQVEFNATGIVKCISHISEVSNIVTAIYHSSNTIATNELFPMETDGLGFVFPNERDETAISSDMILDWVLRKAFEDFIVGLSQSLIEANRFLKLHDLSLRTKDEPIRGQEEMEKILSKIHTEPTRQSVPDLIRTVEEQLSIQLPLKDEILSVNQVRNCLVHRAGIVTDKDTRTTSLILKYLDLVMYVQHSGGQVDVLTTEIKKRNLIIEHIRFNPVIKVVEFPIGEKIKVDANMFKSVTYTVVNFIHQLVQQMPIPDDIKSRLVQPMKIHFDTSRR